MKKSDLCGYPQVRRFLRDRKIFEAYNRAPYSVGGAERVTPHVSEDENPSMLSFLWNSFLINSMLDGWRRKRDARLVERYQATMESRSAYFKSREMFFNKVISYYDAIEKGIKEQDLVIVSDWIEELIVCFDQNPVFLGEYACSNIHGVRLDDIFSRISDLREFIKQQSKSAKNGDCQISSEKSEPATG